MLNQCSSNGCKKSNLNMCQIIDVLNIDDYCCFGTSCNNFQEVVPLMYGFDNCSNGLILYFVILDGSISANNLNCNPNMSGEFEEKQYKGVNKQEIIFDSVIAKGKAIVVTNPVEIKYISNKIANKTAENRAIYNCLSKSGTLTAYKVIVSEVTGRREEYTI